MNIELRVEPHKLVTGSQAHIYGRENINLNHQQVPSMFMFTFLIFTAAFQVCPPCSGDQTFSDLPALVNFYKVTAYLPFLECFQVMMITLKIRIVILQYIMIILMMMLEGALPRLSSLGPPDLQMC